MGATGTVTVIGGGIGGLAASIALRNVGVATQVFERSARFTEAGVAVGLTPNGMTALDALGRGIGDAVRRQGRPLAPDAIFPIRTAGGRTIGSASYGRLAVRHGAPFVMIRRVDLHTVLLHAHGDEGLNPGAEFVELADTDTGVTARFAGGHHVRADLVIGADGLRSAVRAALFGPQPPRFVAATLRGVGRVVLPDELAEGSLTIGEGVTLFSMPLPGANEYHWSAVIKTPAGTWPRDAPDAGERGSPLGEQVGDEAADGGAGPDFAGCATFGFAQRGVGVFGLVQRLVSERDIDEEPAFPLGSGEHDRGRRAGVAQRGGGVTEDVGDRHLVAGDVGGQLLLLTGLLAQPGGGGAGFGEQVVGVVTVAGAGGAVSGGAHQHPVQHEVARVRRATA